MIAAALGSGLALAVAALLAVALLGLVIVAALGSGLALVVVGLLVVVVVSLASLHHLRRLAYRWYLLNKLAMVPLY